MNLSSILARIERKRGFQSAQSELGQAFLEFMLQSEWLISRILRSQTKNPYHTLSTSGNVSQLKKIVICKKSLVKYAQNMDIEPRFSTRLTK
ncbi:hypothetical protein FGO68_gene1733 [Halteria grandinella]|uniref:Uncharacterized protein n=1 Tax=Halteria grandinella TaxID=5974 RepID=A0A8J8T7Y7_HALGN|nr:hypothetical protein FGO68_gene1733 [Halteria grandinella]